MRALSILKLAVLTIGLGMVVSLSAHAQNAAAKNVKVVPGNTVSQEKVAPRGLQVEPVDIKPKPQSSSAQRGLQVEPVDIKPKPSK
ncbi:MAG: hypothetical protein KJ630_21405 [Proteobacteria bacterium]|nr:hypothetical protein [Pseudomonadota bacterium]